MTNAQINLFKNTQKTMHHFIYTFNVHVTFSWTVPVKQMVVYGCTVTKCRRVFKRLAKD